MTRRTHSPRPARAGFTLIELLVVIAIIAILVGIIVPAVQNVRKSGERVKAVAEVSQLATSASAFKIEFGFYPPDSGKIPTNTATVDPQEQQTLTVLRRMFPRWNPSGALAFPNAGSAMNGNQCLVFFLGGPGGTGWDTLNPTNATPASTKKGPYYDFPTNRLVGAPASYVDPWNNPYAYFRSVDGSYQDGATSYGTPGSLWPYRAGGRYVNSTSVQVVSAGPNGQFGPGSPKTAVGPPPVYQDWSPGNGAYTAAGIGGDDLANFNEGFPLGSIR